MRTAATYFYLLIGIVIDVAFSSVRARASIRFPPSVYHADCQLLLLWCIYAGSDDLQDTLCSAGCVYAWTS